MGGLCGCCADEPPENGTMMDHKNGMELIALTEEEEMESGKFRDTSLIFIKFVLFCIS